MGRLTWAGSQYNFSLVTAIRIYDYSGYFFDVVGDNAGDIDIQPAKATTVPAVNNGKPVASVSGPTTPGSLTLELLARDWNDVEVAGTPTLPECLSQENGGTIFQPYPAVAMSGRDGDSGPDYMPDPREKVFKFEIELQPARSGTPTAIKGQLITVYAGVETPNIKIANNGGVSMLSIKGAIARCGMIATSTV